MSSTHWHKEEALAMTSSSLPAAAHNSVSNGSLHTVIKVWNNLNAET
uniref:Uncharacterized protein n=1 Tax=Acrobeloides nanus TaxID=290746 RepID=A0A914DGB5_9BILA